MHLGQWLNEVASFDIGNESGRVVGLTTWRVLYRDSAWVGAREDPWVSLFSQSFRMDQLYTGLRIETGSGKVFEIPPDNPQSLKIEQIPWGDLKVGEVRFRENAFEEFVSRDSRKHEFIKRIG